MVTDESYCVICTDHMPLASYFSLLKEMGYNPVSQIRLD